MRQLVMDKNDVFSTITKRAAKGYLKGSLKGLTEGLAKS